MAKLLKITPDDEDEASDEANELEPKGEETPPIIVGDEEPEEKPEGVVLKPEELEALRAQADQGKALRESIASLGESLRGPGPVNVPQQPPAQTEEDFETKFGERLWEKGKEYETVREAIRREAGPAFASLLGDLSQREKRSLIKGDDERPHFKRFQKEIESFVAELPAAQRSVPGVWERAYDVVASRHQGDLIDELVEARVKEALEKAGVGSTQGAAPQRASMRTQGGGAPSGPAPNPRAKGIRVSAEEHARLAREALNRGMDLDEYIRLEKGG